MEHARDWLSVEVPEPIPMGPNEMALLTIIKHEGEPSRELLSALCTRLYATLTVPPVSIGVYRGTVPPSELDLKGLAMYRRILRWLPTDADILRIAALFSNRSRTSGRTLDTLVTTTSDHHSYYLDITDPEARIVVGYLPGRTVIRFDIGNSYRTQLNKYSKLYFDCFRRGAVVEHPLSDGTVTPVSLCQFAFYHWVDRYRILDYLAQKPKHSTSSSTPGRLIRVPPLNTGDRPVRRLQSDSSRFMPIPSRSGSL